MFKRKNIDPKIQDALFKKINALDRKNFESNSNFFLGGVLDTNENNPISEQIYRACFAKVSVAVPDTIQESNIIQRPLSISSHLNQRFDNEGNLLGVSNKNIPLTFLQGYGERTDNRFRGHSGITKISVTQQEYYTYKFTIDWVCPDPVYFEDVFEPNFLKLGAYSAIEFGWGTEDDSFKIPSLSIEEMVNLLEGTNLLERNKESSGNYYCGVGTITKFDWKIESDGTYTGNIEVLTPGASALLETTQQTSIFSETIPATIQYQKIREKLKTTEIENASLNQEVDKYLGESKSAEDVVDELTENAITFNMVIKNLKDVFDEYLKNVDELDVVVGSSPDSSPYGKNAIGNDAPRFEPIRPTNIKHKSIKNGLLNIKVGGLKAPDYYKNRYWCSWGWFEDNILKDFFELQIQINGKDEKLQTIGSFTDEPNYCQSTEYLYSIGLDHIILPKKHNPILNGGFTLIDDKKKILDWYPLETRRNLRRTHAIYYQIDETFDDFEVTKNQKGSIRNMVFPMEMFQKHFQNIPSLRQGLRNFWTDVMNQYGGYWDFQIGESKEQPNKVGVFDSNYAPELLNFVENSNEEDKDPKGLFNFSIFSKKSIVKSFDISLDLSAEAATLARYGSMSDYQSGNQKVDGKKSLPLEAWNILSSKISSKDAATKQDLNNVRNFKNVVTKVSYPSENKSFYKKIDSIKKDEKKYKEQVETQKSNIVNGVGCYDNRGNFSQYFKSVMIYLITFADAKNSGSYIERGQIVIPVSLTFTLDGIGGLNVGDIFNIDYLPKTYRDNVYFMITKVEHDIQTSGWETSIEARMVVRMKKVWQDSGKKLQEGLEDYLELFKLTRIDDKNASLLYTRPERETRFDTSISISNVESAAVSLTDGSGEPVQAGAGRSFQQTPVVGQGPQS